MVSTFLEVGRAPLEERADALLVVRAVYRCAAAAPGSARTPPGSAGSRDRADGPFHRFLHQGHDLFSSEPPSRDATPATGQRPREATPADASEAPSSSATVTSLDPSRKTDAIPKDMSDFDRRGPPQG